MNIRAAITVVAARAPIETLRANAYNFDIAETTAIGFSSLNNRSARPRNAAFSCVSPLCAFFYGRALVGRPSGLPVPSVAGLLTLSCARPPHLAVDGGPSFKPKEPALRAVAFARPEQTEFLSPEEPAHIPSLSHGKPMGFPRETRVKPAANQRANRV